MTRSSEKNHNACFHDEYIYSATDLLLLLLILLYAILLLIILLIFLCSVFVLNVATNLLGLRQLLTPSLLLQSGKNQGCLTMYIIISIISNK
jgi:hypothetical protein